MSVELLPASDRTTCDVPDCKGSPRSQYTTSVDDLRVPPGWVRLVITTSNPGPDNMCRRDICPACAYGRHSHPILNLLNMEGG